MLRLVKGERPERPTVSRIAACLHAANPKLTKDHVDNAPRANAPARNG